MKGLKYLAFTCLFLLTLMVMSPLVSADFGPKPTANINVIGLDEDYYFDLLIYSDEPVDILTDTEVASQIEYYYYRDDYPSVLNGFQDEDGFVSYTLYRDIPHTITKIGLNEYKIGYVGAPALFKIVLVTETNENILISEELERTYFIADFIFDLSADSVVEEQSSVSGMTYLNVGSSWQDLKIGNLILYVFVGLFATLILEVGLLYLVKYRERRTYKIVLITNVTTQLLLNVFLWLGYNVGYNIFGYLLVLFIGEIIVFSSEAIIYQIFFQERKKIKPILYAILANALSLLFGFAIIGILGM